MICLNSSKSSNASERCLFVCLFACLGARTKCPIFQLVLVGEEHKFAICVYALTLNTSVSPIHTGLFFDFLDQGGGEGGKGCTARKIAFTPRLYHKSKVSKAIFDHTFDYFLRESKAIFDLRQM